MHPLIRHAQTVRYGIAGTIAVALIVVSVERRSSAAPAAMPDLIVRGDKLAQQWLVRDENLSASFCSVEEGGITPGTRRLIRFTVMTPNIGNADIFVGDPNDHIAQNDGLFEFATCHQHYHFRHYALYELIDPATNVVWKAAKRGFCMLDTDPNPDWLAGVPPKNHEFRSCGAIGIPGHQGISAGWADTYRFFLGGQYFVLDGGDGQPVVPPGDYVIRITVNPAFAPASGEPCPNTDSQGLCHQLPESNYANNSVSVSITIPDRPGKTGYGPAAGALVQADEADEHGDKVKK